MGGVKCLVCLGSRAAMLLLLMALASQTQMGRSQNCANELSNLTACAPFVVPVPRTSPPTPSVECCNALHGVDQNCLCTTLQIISRLPAQCNLSPVTCRKYFQAFREYIYCMIDDGSKISRLQVFYLIK
uniref:Bifunctional inhibitor/plant lipid transfer protein/seed storage helical domain-containing protein n=1 Tax=Nelumbo nucifera TaxID=4432 RepID=A0A822XI42_NELNU|nr:TPA_asm: hypothetical protein HUJ06_020264 [Nelumbo nucifera]